MNRLSRPLFILLCTLAGAGSARAAATTPQARLRAETEERSRAEVGDLLRTLCPEQCVLVAVEARVEEEALAGAPPGFETLSGGAALPIVRSVSARVLVDSQLPAPFRTRLKDLVAQRLKTVGPQPAVEVETVAFPPRNAPHLEATPREPKPQPTPAATPPPPEPEAKAVAPLNQRAEERLLEAAPLLAVAALLALTVLVLGVLLVVATRRAASPPPGLDYGPEPLPAPEPAPLVPPTPPVDYPAVRARRLERSLREERSLRNTVLREALARGEARQVALWTREMGEFLLEDLRGDPALAPALSTLAAELGRVPVPTPSARAAAAVGTGSVAEAAALLHGGTLTVPKTVHGRVTVAVSR